jgi:exodeoxyribonuclease VII small subunit
LVAPHLSAKILAHIAAWLTLLTQTSRVKAYKYKDKPMSENPTPQTDIAAMSFEAAMSELEQLVARLASGQASLEDSIALYERGAKLKAHCDSRLKAAQMRVDQIVESSAGISLEPAKLG